MPWVAWLALVGTLAIAGLPPLNGFVSEWLLLQAFLLHAGLPAVVPQHARAASPPPRWRSPRHWPAYVHGEVLRRDLPRSAARAEPRRTRTTPGCVRSASAWPARRGLRAARRVSGRRRRRHRPRQRHAARRPAWAPRERRTGCCSRPSRPRRSSYSPLIVARGDRRRRADHVRGGAPRIAWPRAPGAAVGLRLPAADAAHAGHRRKASASRSGRFRAVLPHGAAPARPRSTQSRATACAIERSLLALALPADRPRGGNGRALRRAVSSRAGISVYLTLQLRDPDRAAGLRPMSGA